VGVGVSDFEGPTRVLGFKETFRFTKSDGSPSLIYLRVGDSSTFVERKHESIHDPDGNNIELSQLSREALQVKAAPTLLRHRRHVGSNHEHAMANHSEGLQCYIRASFAGLAPLREIWTCCGLILDSRKGAKLAKENRLHDGYARTHTKFASESGQINRVGELPYL